MSPEQLVSLDQLLETLNVIKNLGWVIGALLTFIGGVGGFLLTKMYNTIMKDHDITTTDHEKVTEIYPMVKKHEQLLTKLETEHQMHHSKT